MSYLKVIFNDDVSTKAVSFQFKHVGLLINLLLNFVFVTMMVKKFANNFLSRFTLLFLVQNVILVLMCFVAVDFSRWFFFANLTSLLAYEKIFFYKIPVQSFHFLKLIPRRESYAIILFLLLGCPTGGWDFNQYFRTTPVFKVMYTPKLIYDTLK